MNIVQYTDNETINKIITGNMSVYSVADHLNGDKPKESLMKHFPEVFAEEVGQLDSEYHIKIDPPVSPVQHPPHQIPAAVSEQLKSQLDCMMEQDTIILVTTPAMPWASPLVVIPKKDRELKLCLDPKDLNQAIQREHYPLPTIEDVATHLHGVKAFKKLNVRNHWYLSRQTR